MPPLLIVNPRSGDGGLAELLAAAAARAIPVHTLEEGDDAAKIARGADADALAVAGGDGSLAAVAAVAIELDLPFACVPFGTRNHFARDVGLDRSDPAATLDALVDGSERRIDVGRANDRLFLNNVSLGVYAQLVHRREHHRRRRDAFARLRALGIAATHRHPLGITVDGEPVTARVVLIANNAYALDVLSIGERARLDEGQLHLYAPRFDSVRGVLKPTWDERAGDRFTIDARAGSLRAAFDGEPGRLATPIDFRIEPGALRLLVPSDPLA
ncbi:MAG TPA: diacylglycerol kinase family protein [Gaiellaceae bacterium]